MLYHVPFKARLTPPPPPAFNCSEENMIKSRIRLQEEEAMKRLRLKENKIREKFRLKEDELLEKLRQGRQECITLDGVSESLARMGIDKKLLKGEDGISQQGCTVLKKHNKKAGTTKDDDMEFQSEMPYGDQPLKPKVVNYGKENEENYPPRRGYRKGTGTTPRPTFPLTNRTNPNKGTNARPASDTRYSLFALEQDLATSANIEELFFKQPPPTRPTAEKPLQLNPNINNFKSDFPGRRGHNPPRTPPNRIIVRTHSPGQQSSSFFSEPDDSEKENLDELVGLRQHHLLFAPPTSTTASKAKPNSYISSGSAPCSPTGRKRVRDDSPDDFGGGMTSATTSLINTSSPVARQIFELITPSIPQLLAYGCQRSLGADMSMEPQVKRARLSPPARLESSKPLLRDFKGLFGPQSLGLR